MKNTLIILLTFWLDMLGFYIFSGYSMSSSDSHDFYFFLKKYTLIRYLFHKKIKFYLVCFDQNENKRKTWDSGRHVHHCLSSTPLRLELLLSQIWTPVGPRKRGGDPPWLYPPPQTQGLVHWSRNGDLTRNNQSDSFSRPSVLNAVWRVGLSLVVEVT